MRRHFVYRLTAAAPFGGWRHHLCPAGKHVTGFSGRDAPPTNPVPLLPQLRWWDYGYSALCHMTLQGSVEQTSPAGGSTAAGGDRGAFPRA